MLRLYLDHNQGAGVIPCPVCGRPLLLAADRMGRWLVSYRGGFRVRPGERVMLVCPSYDCDHREPVEIARTPDDAVVFSPCHASSLFQMEARAIDKTLDELEQEVERLMALARRSGNPKLPSLIRYWRERYGFAYSQVRSSLKQAYEEENEVICRGKDYRERGWVRALLPDGVLLERSQDGETIFLRAGEMCSAACYLELSNNLRFDFGVPTDAPPIFYTMHTPRRFVVIAGYPMALDDVTQHGLCRVHTHDPEVARAFGLRAIPGNGFPGDQFLGEFPAALVERHYLLVRYCHVQGHKLNFVSITTDPNVVQLGTHDLEVARALQMRRAWTYCGQRKALRWLKCFQRSEITDEVEIQVPMRLPRPNWLKMQGGTRRR